MQTQRPPFWGGAKTLNQRPAEAGVKQEGSARRVSRFGRFLMFAVRRSLKKGFTLVEILIVVIILGILAAIVIPQFTSASEDARKNSLTSQTQTLRSQVELFKLQHTPAAAATLFGGTTPAEQWEELLKKTDADGTFTGTLKFGPYLQTLPVNGLNNLSTVVVNTTVDETTTSGLGTFGFAYNSDTGKFFAVKDGGVYVGN
jgi:general secretion pathway protein G